MPRITPCLWFDGNAEAAVRFYQSIFHDTKVTDSLPPAGDGGETGNQPGKQMSLTFELDGQAFIALNGGPMFKFTPAISLFVRCESQNEVDHYWEKLLDGGEAQRCGWLTDRFGLSWQVVPVALGEMLGDLDRSKAGRVMQAMMKMVKLDVAALRAAYDAD